MLEFEASEPDQDEPPIDFAVTMLRQEDGEKVRREFLARPRGAVNYGALLDALQSDTAAGLFQAFRRMLDPEQYEAFHDFITDDELWIDGKVVSKIANGLIEQYGERPTGQSDGSRATRRAAQRGSAAPPPPRGGRPSTRPRRPAPLT